jgi:hypothetical protein
MVLWATIRSTRTISAVTEPAALSVSALEQRELPVRAELEAGGAVDLVDGRQRGRLDGWGLRAVDTGARSTTVPGTLASERPVGKVGLAL